jgi:hypothetical protein
MSRAKVVRDLRGYVGPAQDAGPGSIGYHAAAK